MGKWSDDSACILVHDVRLYSVLDTMVIFGEDVCCSVVFGILVGVFVFSVMWSVLLITSAIRCPLWSSVYEYHKVECTFTSPARNECGMFVMCCIQYDEISITFAAGSVCLCGVCARVTAMLVCVSQCIYGWYTWFRCFV